MEPPGSQTLNSRRNDTFRIPTFKKSVIIFTSKYVLQQFCPYCFLFILIDNIELKCNKETSHNHLLHFWTNVWLVNLLYGQIPSLFDMLFYLSVLFGTLKYLEVRKE